VYWYKVSRVRKRRRRASDLSNAKIALESGNFYEKMTPKWHQLSEIK